MAKSLEKIQQGAIDVFYEKLTAPLLYLSSEEAGWEGLTAHAFHEPMEMEGWFSPPPSRDIALVLFQGGAMHMEQRPINGSWKALRVHQGDLMLQAEPDPASEVRWWNLTNAPTQTFHLSLSRELFVRTAEEVVDRDPDHLSLAGRAGFQDPLLTQIGFTLWRELAEHSPAGKLYAQTAAQMLAVHLLRHYTSVGERIKEPAQGLTQQQMRRLTDFVQAHLGQDLSLEALAQQTGFSPYYFARLFRMTTGASPHQFVMQQRIERAQQLLKKTDTPLAQVALESGFANQSHLTHAFKRNFGLTPRAYRQNSTI
jgi:AraC family transcriptional regulator